METLCRVLPVVVLVAACGGTPAMPATTQGGADPPALPSWADGAVTSAIVDFVQAVSSPGSVDFLEPPERIAVFDNDGTLWVEQPIYPQLAFALDRVHELAPNHPAWRTTEPFASVLSGDMAAVAASGDEGLLRIVAATHGGVSAREFAETVEAWLDSARHPRFGRRYTDLVYQPQLELIDYLYDHGFRVFIVSGGGVAFLRVWSEGTYGIPPDRVVGSRLASEYRGGDHHAPPEIHRLPELAFVNDGSGKPVGIYEHIGRQPVLAFGNSDGDLEMLDYTLRGGEGDGPRLALILHHTDAEREYAYDRDTHVGRLDRGLAEADARGLTVVDMERDWRRVFPSRGSEGLPPLATPAGRRMSRMAQDAHAPRPTRR